MTSSLVGSEMCIRDSIGTDLVRLSRSGRRCRKRWTGRLHGASGRQVAVPVSYTHLTLPTICSV
eukprot:9927490-Prorocentrum_lima.AAC.1